MHEQPSRARLLRPVSDLLDDAALDVREHPTCRDVFSALDLILATANQGEDGAVEVPMVELAARAGDFVGVFFAMSMLRPGLAVISGRCADGTQFEGEALLDEAARREAAGLPALQVFYRVQASQLAVDDSFVKAAA